jgi:hypothetical protein
MNLVSFVDELVKLGAGRQLLKRAYGGPNDGDGAGNDANTVDVPHGMMGADSPPPSDRVSPSEASTRLPLTYHLPSTVQSGNQGDITEPKDPIDKHKYNRAYRDRR